MSTTILRRSPAQQEAHTEATLHNMRREDWSPRFGPRMGMHYRVENVVFPDGHRPTLYRTQNARYSIGGREHLGTHRTREEAARIARAEALREWTAKEAGE